MNYIEYLEKNLDILQENLKKDDAGYASTMLHRFRRRLEELNSIRYFLVAQNKIYGIDSIDDQIEEIRKIIHERLEKRISWQAGLIDQTIANRKAKGTYKGEFTTATILANAYNDIFQAIDETFNGETVALKCEWISPSDKLPEINQEVEFIARRHLFEGDSGVRERFLGVYKQMFLNPPHCIFYASAPGWGCEFLPKEVEYWMSKTPMPEDTHEHNQTKI